MPKSPLDTFVARVHDRACVRYKQELIDFTQAVWDARRALGDADGAENLEHLSATVYALFSAGVLAGIRAFAEATDAFDVPGLAEGESR
jgi:hypothetical protein